MNSVQLAIFFFTLSLNAFASFPPTPTQNDLKDCEQGFKFKGKLINPRVIQLFEGWESDSGVPIVTSADISAAYGTNQFFDDDVKYGPKGATYKESSSDNTSDPSTFGYEWIGRLQNGDQVVETTSGGGGGTLVEHTLLILKCSMGKGWRPTGHGSDPSRLLESKAPSAESYSRLLLTVERYYIIGDRVAADYSIHGNSLTVTFANQPKRVTKVIKVDD